MYKSFRITATVVMTSIASLALAETSTLDSFRALSPVEVATKEITATLKPITVADADSAAKGVLQGGDRIAFEIDGVEGAKVYILNMDSEGVIQMIYPNKFVQDEAAEMTETLMVPADGAPYEFEVGGVAGTEVVKVIAIDSDSSAFEALLGTLFDSEKTFPRALEPTATTTKALSDFLENSDNARIREATVEYVIAK